MIRIFKYIVTVLILCAVVADMGAQTATQAVPLDCNRRVLSPRSRMAVGKAQNSVVSAYVTVDDGYDRETVEQLCQSFNELVPGMATARIQVSRLHRLSEVDGVRYVQVSSPAQCSMDLARPDVGADLIHHGTSLARPYTGKGVVVGIVDNGFDYRHAAFRNADSSLRIRRVWEQFSNPSGQLTSPEAFGYGVELVDEQAILDASGDIFNNSHGTHVANIAAGSDNVLDGLYCGMAPDADIVLVALGEVTADNVNISNAISYIFDYASQVGKPCVVNLSLATNHGPHDGTSIFDTLADAMQGPGRIIVGASGNFRADKFHVSRTLDVAENDTLRTFINFKSGISESKTAGNIDIWGSLGMDMRVFLSVYSSSKGTVSERIQVYPAETDGVARTSLGRNVSGYVDVAGEINPANGKPCVSLSPCILSVRTNHSIAIEVVAADGGQVDIWADNLNLGLTSNDIPGYEEPGTASTVAEIGGTARRILTVGAYNTRVDYVRYNETDIHSLTETLGDISSFSSFGPTADGRVKPDITAPGSFISSAVSSNDGSGHLVVSDVHVDGDGKNNMYGYMQGTSMSAPMVTGIVALWLQAYPELTPEQLTQVIASTARNDEFTGLLSQPDNDWGYGKIDAMAGLLRCINMADPDGLSDVAVSNATIVLNGDNIDIYMASQPRDASVEIYTLSGIRMVHQSVTSQVTTIKTGDLSAGVYVLRLSDNGAVSTLKFVR